MTRFDKCLACIIWLFNFINLKFIEIKETLEAVKELSLFFGENNINTRRYLRSNLEKRSLIYNEKFLACFGEAKKVVDALYSDVNSMNDICQQVTKKLGVNNFNCKAKS
jgi:component of oligomeric golgi complex, putative